MSRTGRGCVAARAIVGLALCSGLPAVALAQAECPSDDQCRYKKPNLLVVIDYSSSMVGFADSPAYFPAGQTATTRWDAQLDAVRWILRYDDGFFANNARVALARFAHDPRTDEDGTTIGSDVSFPPIVDGFALDVPFDGSDGRYLECKGSAVDAEVEVLRTTPPPWIQQSLSPDAIMLTWTRGALASAHRVVEDTRARHAGEPGEEDRVYEVVLMTDGDWTCPDMIGQACNENPAPEARVLYDDGIRVHVVAFADAAMQPSLDEVALQGGTASSIDATSPRGIIDALGSVLDTIRDSVIVPECTRALPRVLVIVDGSSSMIAGSAPGETKWDKARFALAGNPAAPNPDDPGYVEPIFSRRIELDGNDVAIEDVVHLGLMSFAGADTQVTMVGFGPCMRDNFAWAMDPLTSCEPPGCTNPYAGYPLTWTFKQSGSDGAPSFVRPTRSFMPSCNETPGSSSCVGQVPNTFTGQGLEAARALIEGYKHAPAPFVAGAATPYVNILITDGQTSAGSSDVQSALEAMVADGIDTYVIGFGTDAELDQAQLEDYARWGNTGEPIVVRPDMPDSADALAAQLAAIITSIDLDGCCVLHDCTAEPEPPDPGPVCGDGRIEGGEACDDGPLNASYDHCSARCDGLHLYCGDGRVDAPEQCDDAAPSSTADCGGCLLDGVANLDADGGVAPVPDNPLPVRPPPGSFDPPTAGRGEAMDGGLPARLPDQGDGCGCRVPGRSGGSGRTGLAFAVLAALAAGLSSRTRRHTRRAVSAMPPRAGPAPRRGPGAAPR